MALPAPTTPSRTFPVFSSATPQLFPVRENFKLEKVPSAQVSRRFFHAEKIP